MENHKRYIIFGSDDNYTILAEYDSISDVEKFIKTSSWHIQDLLIVQFIPIQIRLDYEI